MEKIITVSIIGPGSRGLDTYGKYILAHPEHYKLVAICGGNLQKTERRVARLTDSVKCFGNEDEFFAERRSDLLIIASPDICHYRHCKLGLLRGYDILVEKPVCDSEEQYEDLLRLQGSCQVYTGYVLRCLPVIQKIKQLLVAGEIGTIKAIQATEQAELLAFIHSYVRGRWKNQAGTSPTILAKCSHDLDLIWFFAGNSNISSIISLKSGNISEDKAYNGKCLACDKALECPYDAKKFYLDAWKVAGEPEDQYPYNTIAEAPITETKIIDALNNTLYGSCIYGCAADAVQYQTVAFNLDNTQCSLSMNGYSGNGGRIIKIFGDHGEIDWDEEQGKVFIKKPYKETQAFDIRTFGTEAGYSHAMADDCLMEEVYKGLTNQENCAPTLQESLYSHIIGWQAENK